MKRIFLALAAFGCWRAPAVMADPLPFDLTGPALRVTVTRQGATLPVDAVPQLATGDRLRIAADFPADQTARYLLIAAFLRDPTNPPPGDWFVRSDSWRRAGHGGGPIELTVPPGAQHVVLFLAPATGGDFATLRQAVLARPGAFVRAAQDLEQASLDRSRYEAYLTAIRRIAAAHVPDDSPDALAHVGPVVAGSLRIRINEDCLQRQPDLQAPCLLDSRQAIVLGNDTSGSTAITAAATDLAFSLSSTPAGGFGIYSPYISAIRDIVGIFSAMHTARYQYIPALGIGRGEQLALVLNSPPSFANPKSVMMAALPEVKAPEPPILTVSPAAAVPCLGAPRAVLPVPVGPLFFATAYAHDLGLRVHLPGGGALDLPLAADVTRGGLVIGGAQSLPPGLAGPLSATVHGRWGFAPLAGPDVTLATAGDWRWRPAAAGRDAGQLVLTGAPAACVAAVTARTASGETHPVPWKIAGPHEIALALPAALDPRQPVTLVVAGPAGSAPAQIAIAAPARSLPPFAQIVAHSSEDARSDQPPGAAIVLDGSDEIPADARLNFTVRAGGKDVLTGHETVEVGTADGDETARLAPGSGLTRLDSRVLVASLVPAQALGASAFGPLRARLVNAAGAGEWLSLGTLVRLPRLKQLACPADPAMSCVLSGDGLYLLASVSATRDFDEAVSVAEGYPGFTLTVPRPASREGLFVRLHDSPEVINRLRAAR